MKKFEYNDYGIEIITDVPKGDIIKFFSNKIETRLKAFVYICDNSRYPKRVGIKIGEFESNGSTYLNFNKYIFEKGKFDVYLNPKGNFFIVKL